VEERDRGADTRVRRRPWPARRSAAPKSNRIDATRVRLSVEKRKIETYGPMDSVSDALEIQGCNIAIRIMKLFVMNPPERASKSWAAAD
jgi:hypothetical protein